MSTEAVTTFLRSIPRVEVFAKVEREERTRQSDGEKYETRTQLAYLSGIDENGVEERQRIRLSLSRDAEPYAPGTYTLGAPSFARGKWGDPELARYLVLVPIPEVLTRMASASAPAASGSAKA